MAATADRPKKKPGRRAKFSLAPGNGWAARVARGLTRWRESRGLTIPIAAAKFEVNQTTWYRLEGANHPSTTAIHLDAFCEALKIDVLELIKLGE